MSATVQQIINKLSTLLDIRYIYRPEIGPKDHDKPLFIVIMEGNCSSLSHELSSMVGKIFQDETDSLYRLFSYGYAQQQLKDENLFFVAGCSWTNLIHQNSVVDTDVFHRYAISEETITRIRSHFNKELERIGGFINGADFFLKNGDLPSSAFMFHQVMELLFRTVELFMMGKERKSHSIKEHQTYIGPFAPDLGCLFDVGIAEEQLLLKLLDDAYLTTRYGNNYHINDQQIQMVRKRANDMQDMVVNLFEDKFKAISKPVGPPNNFEDVRLKADSDETISDPLERLGKIESLVMSRFKLLKPYENRHGFFKIQITTEGYLDTSFIISNLLKVCILAMSTDEYPERLIPQPNHNVQEVLKLILELIPTAEMELLDDLRDML